MMNISEQNPPAEIETAFTLLSEGMPSPNNISTLPPSTNIGGKTSTTFRGLFAEHRRVALLAGITGGTINVHLSQTRRFLRMLGLNEDTDPCFIANENAFRAETDKAIAAFGFDRKAPGARALRSGVCRVRATFLLGYEATPITVQEPGAFQDFWSAFIHFGTVAAKLGYLGRHPANVRGLQGQPRKPNGHLLRSFGISEGTVSTLKKGIRRPLSPAMMDRFIEVENLLRVPPTTLTRHITFRGHRVVKAEHRTNHSQRYSEAGAFRYSIAIKDWPEQLRSEFNEFSQDKKKGRWTTRKDGYAGTADRTLGMLEAFVGWLCLPIHDNKWRSGQGKSLGSIESVFAELVTPQTLDQYMDFRLAHTVSEADFQSGEGRLIFNTTLRNLYHLAAHLLKPPHKFKSTRPAGFVFRNPDRYAKLLHHLLPTSSYDLGTGGFVLHETTHERWLAFCQKSRSSFFETIEGAENTGRSGKSRATDAGIEQILALPNPRTAIAELLSNIRRDYEGYSWEMSPYDKAMYCRRQVFLELMAIAPHRVRIWAILARRDFAERTDAQGERRYHLHIDRAEFKNHRYLDVDYELDLPSRLTPLIDLYFSLGWAILNAPVGTLTHWRDENKGRAHLMDSEGNIVPVSNDCRYRSLKQITSMDRVFGMAFGTSVKESNRRVLNAGEKTKTIIQSLQRLTLSVTGRFLGEAYKTNGFYPHAFRHICATAEIRTTGSFERAALLLWDSVEMVMKTYSHVKRSDLLTGVVEAHESEYERLSKAVDDRAKLGGR